MQSAILISMYQKAGALLDGHFILSSGRHSSRYLQSALVLRQPSNAIQLAAELIPSIDVNNIDVIAAPALGGLLIGYEVARQLDKPFIFTERKEGQMQLRRGFAMRKDTRLLVVEDVMTTGKSVNECISALNACGGNVVAVRALVDRSPLQTGRFNVPHQTLLQLDTPSWAADVCPLCAAGVITAIKPGSRGAA
ncbi:MAG: orotate phosphoribosyltransferase [Mariprofundales bacterium]